MTDSPLFREAVEAAHRAATTVARESYEAHLEAALLAALPHLDRLFRERYAAALEAEMKPFVIHGSPEHISRETLRLAASFLRREPTL